MECLAVISLILFILMVLTALATIVVMIYLATSLGSKNLSDKPIQDCPPSLCSLERALMGLVIRR
jgi:hypothetical protein